MDFLPSRHSLLQQFPSIQTLHSYHSFSNDCFQGSLSNYTLWLNYLFNLVVPKCIYISQIFLFFLSFFSHLFMMVFYFFHSISWGTVLSLQELGLPQLLGFSLPTLGAIIVCFFAHISLHLMHMCLATSIFCSGFLQLDGKRGWQGDLVFATCNLLFPFLRRTAGRGIIASVVPSVIWPPTPPHIRCLCTSPTPPRQLLYCSPMEFASTSRSCPHPTLSEMFFLWIPARQQEPHHTPCSLPGFLPLAPQSHQIWQVSAYFFPLERKCLGAGPQLCSLRFGGFYTEPGTEQLLSIS